MGNCHPVKTNVDRGEAEVYIGFKGGQFSMLPSCAVNTYYILLNVNQIHCLHYILFQNNPGQVNIFVCISYSVYSNAHMMLVRIYGEPNVHEFCAVDIILEYHPWTCNITRC